MSTAARRNSRTLPKRSGPTEGAADLSAAALVGVVALAWLGYLTCAQRAKNMASKLFRRAILGKDGEEDCQDNAPSQ